MLNLLARGLSPLTRGKQAASATSGGGLPVHPRSRRKNLSTRFVEWLMGGSSPLTRGKQHAHVIRTLTCGIIPAHAGKTLRASLSSALLWAHPHSRGENSRTDPIMELMPGSSPLTRGKLVVRVAVQLPAGLIPTHAGKTPARPEPQASPRAHPRSRGENMACAPAFVKTRGSSPLTRGKPDYPHGIPRVPGLIPAHAGKTFPLSSCARSGGAHPHSRGENAGTTQRPPPLSGSSPLTRGVLHGCRDRDPRVGLIPTHAGKTLRRR